MKKVFSFLILDKCGSYWVFFTASCIPSFTILYFTETNINGMDFPFLFKGDLFLNMWQNKHNETTFHLVLFT